VELLVNSASESGCNEQFWVIRYPRVDDSSFGVLVSILYDSRQLLVPSGITVGVKRVFWTG
jgi:hypothetical protein